MGKNTDKELIAFQIDRQLKEALELKANQECRSISSLIRLAIKKYLESCETEMRVEHTGVKIS